MPTIRRYFVALSPAKRDPKNPEIIEIEITKTIERKTFMAASLAAAVKEAKAFGAACGQPCSIYLACRDRKPPGFDRAAHGLYAGL